jgi:hypothetical protein
MSLNLKDRNEWSEGNAAKISEVFGFLCDEVFLTALRVFINEVVNKATVTDLLSSSATNYFKSQKGLQKLPKKRFKT